MGWFSSLCSGIKNVASKVVNTVKNVASKAVEKVKDVYQTFTGEKEAKRAKKIYEDAKRKYEDEFKKYQNEKDKIVSSISDSLEKINTHKKEFMESQIKDYLSIISKIKDAQIQSKEVLEVLEIENVIFDTLKSKDQVILIDFDKNRVMNNLKAILTLGFSTRKKARESLERASKESVKVDKAIQEMKSEIERLRQVNNSLENIEFYFAELREVIEDANEHLKFTLNQARTKIVVLSQKLVSSKVSMKNMPKVSLSVFMLTNTLIKVLVEMCKKSYISTGKSELLNKEISEVINLKNNNKKVVSDLREAA